MTRYRQKLLAVSLLILISMPMGFFVCYKVQELLLKHEMMEKLEWASLQAIEIPASEVQWYEEDREIIVNGKLFDVKSHQVVTGTNMVRFTGLFDEDETVLKDKVNLLLQQQENDDDTNKSLVQAIWLFNCPLHHSASSGTGYTDFTKEYAPLITSAVPLVEIAIPAPPPKA